MQKIKNVIMLAFLIALVGCGCNTPQGKESVVEDKNTEQADTLLTEDDRDSEITTGVDEQNYEQVSADEFLTYYHMDKGTVPLDYLEAFIAYRQLTKESLSERNYDVMVKKMYDKGVSFGDSIIGLISGSEISYDVQDDFTDVTYIIINKDIYEYGTDLATMQNIILDVKNNKIYEVGDMNTDYAANGKTKEISEQSATDCVEKLRTMITDDWKEFHPVADDKTYSFKIYVVKQNGTLICFEGEGIDEVYHPGLEEWIQSLQQ